MYIDASAIVAIILDEQDAAHLLTKLKQSTKPIYYSPVTFFEASVSIARQYANDTVGPNAPIAPEHIHKARPLVEQLLKTLNAREVTVGAKTGRIAVEAAATYGKVVAHPARLNFGDCFVYACSKELRIPLLCKGNDFPQTDIELA